MKNKFILLMAIFMIAALSCTKDKELLSVYVIGTWKSEPLPGISISYYLYTFNPEGKFIKELYLNGTSFQYPESPYNVDNETDHLMMEGTDYYVVWEQSSIEMNWNRGLGYNSCTMTRQ